MDTLTHLIQLAQPQASLELRCQFERAFSIDHDKRDAGNAPFHLVLAGTCKIKPQRGATLTLKTGDFVLFPHGGEHRIFAGTTSTAHPARVDLADDGMLPLRINGNGNGEADVDLLCGRFDYQSGPAALLMHALPDPLHVALADSESPALQALVTLMRDEAEQHKPGALAIVTALSQALLTLALRTYGEKHTDTSNVIRMLADARLGAAVNAIVAEPGRDWTIADLGSIAAMSRATFARHFRDEAGMTVGDFLTKLRMSIASKLLKKTNRSAADIGMEVGYQSEAAFGRTFQQAMGTTPGRYRRIED